MKPKMRWASILLLATLSSGCSKESTPVSSITPPQQQNSVNPQPAQAQPSEFKVLAVTFTKVGGDHLAVKGVTDLPDGSRIHVTLDIADYDPKATYIGSGIDVNAAGGKFEGEIPIPARPEFREGPYVVEAMFTPKNQPQAVIDIVGVNGERLAAKPSGYPFKVMEASLRLKKLDFKVKTATIPSRDQFVPDSPERLYIDVVTAWSKKDWMKMTNLTQKTWRQHESDPTKSIQAQFEHFTPFGVVGKLQQSPGPLSNMKVITATLEGAIGSRVHKRRVLMNIVMESGAWGWNPTSALRQQEVP